MHPIMSLGLMSSLLVTSAFFSVSAFAAEQGCVAGSMQYDSVKVHTVDGRVVKWPNRTLVEIQKRSRNNDSVKVVRLDNSEVAYVYSRFLAHAEVCTGGAGNNNPNPNPDANPETNPTPRPADDDSHASRNENGSRRGSDSKREEFARLANAGRHTIGYNAARERLFQYVDVREKGEGERYVQSIYSKDVLAIVSPGIPRDSFNVEHTWPQSQLKKYSSFGASRADMYHIFSVETQINGARGCSPFVECQGSDDSWTSQQCNGGFEPPPEQKGITARAMFYMSVAYDMPIDSRQEAVLREWNEKYPVSDYERQRAKKVQEIQGNVNPFVEHPEWVSQVSDF